MCVGEVGPAVRDADGAVRCAATIALGVGTPIGTATKAPVKVS